MRSLLLLAVLASACDQGANATPPKPAPVVQVAAPEPPPPPVYEPFSVRDNADFVVKAGAILEEMFAIFEQATQDCDALASRIEQWGESNTTRFAILTAYGKAHPETEKPLQEKFQPHLERLTNAMVPVLTRCMTGEHSQRMTKAFEKIAQTTQMQRPR